MNGDSDGNTGASPAADTPATGSNVGINTTSANIAEPSDEEGDAVLARITLGMVVMDVNGEQAGTVGGVQFAGTDVLPEAPSGSPKTWSTPATYSSTAPGTWPTTPMPAATRSTTCPTWSR